MTKKGPLSKSEKTYIEEMKKNFSSNNSVMIAQYQGLNVNELDELRKQLREKGILFKITKNRITKIAIKETPVKDMEKYFSGPTAAALATQQQPASPGDKAGFGCVLGHALVAWHPTIVQPPPVDLRVRGHLAQPLPLYTSMRVAFC